MAIFSKMNRSNAIKYYDLYLKEIQLCIVMNLKNGEIIRDFVK
jgi:hypothetical protein